MEMDQGGQRNRIAAFHIVDARAVCPVTFDAPGQVAAEGAHRMHGIHMAKYEQSRPILLPGDASDQDVGGLVTS
jgi:hypothetical protein